VPAAAASITVLAVVVAVTVVALSFGGLVAWSMLTGQGFLPDWEWVPAAPWASDPAGFHR
jgi:hypothetical protein